MKKFISIICLLFLNLIQTKNYQNQITHKVFKDISEQEIKDIVQKIDINKKDKYGFTPLMYAAYYGRTQIAKLLLINGANPNITTTYGRTALMIAADNSNNKILKLLLRNGANVYLKDRDNKTALDYARSKNNKKSIQFLEKFISNNLEQEQAEIQKLVYENLSKIPLSLLKLNNIYSNFDINSFVKYKQRYYK